MLTPRNWNECLAQLGSWEPYLKKEIAEDYMKTLLDELRGKKIIRPCKDKWFAAFEATPFEKVKVVILGQDPYWKEGLAHGLSFSVPEGQIIPSSLKNVFKELKRDKDVLFDTPKHGCLKKWTEQGVLLLNTVLTVGNTANSHKGIGWQEFTQAALKALKENAQNVVFLAWGNSAKETLGKVGISSDEYGNDEGKHRLLAASHPSGFSAYQTETPFLDNNKKGKTGCRHFSKANEYLKKHGRGLIDWQI